MLPRASSKSKRIVYWESYELGFRIFLLMSNIFASRAQLERELETVGIRLNQDKPNVAFKVKAGGGITINATVKLTKINEKMVQHILHDYSKYSSMSV
jgi:ribosome-interacting GTPase 1